MIPTELPYQTYERVTGKKWTGGGSPDVLGMLKQAGITERPGSSAANLALQGYLQGGINTSPMAAMVPNQTVSPSLTPAATPSDTGGQNILEALSSMTGEDTYRKQMSDMITQMQQQQKDYMATQQAQPSPMQTYTQYREQLGLPAQEAALTTTSQQIQNTEDLLTNLESDINARASGMAMTEPLRQRLLATEQAPITKELQQLSSLAGVQQTGVTSARDQLSQLLQMAQAGQTQQTALAQEPLQFTQALLPTMEKLAQYQSPKEQLAQEIMKQMILTQVSPTKAEAPATVGTAETGILQYNPQTGRYDIPVTSPIPKTATAAGEADKVLSPADAKALGVPYGTTQSEAAGMNITPSKLTPAEAATSKTIQMQISNANTAINQLYALSQKVNTMSDGILANLNGIKRSQLGKYGYDTDAESFAAIRGTIKNIISLSLIPGGRGFGLRYTAGDVEDALPKITDTKEDSLNKLSNLMGIIKDYKDSWLDIYGPTGTTIAGATGGTASSGIQWKVIKQ
jgi:hypothetical protein